MSQTTVLIVEDEAIVAADLASKLKRLGYGLCGSTGLAEEAILLAREKRPDLILMDIRLAGAMDGVNAAEVIRRELDLPVIFLTAHSDHATLQRAKLAEPFGYILKPFEERELATVVEMAHYRHQAERKLHRAHAELEHRLGELEAANISLRESRRATLTIMEESVTARRQAEAANASLRREVEERRRAEEALSWYARRNEVLMHAASRLLESDDPQALVEKLCRQVMELVDCDAFFNFLVSESEGRLRLNAGAGLPPEELERIRWLDFDQAVCGYVAYHGESVIAEDIPHTPDSRTELIKAYGIKAYCCHPLKVQGRVLGTLSFGTRSRPRLDPRQVDVMRAVADLVAMAMHRVETERRLRQSREDLDRAQAVGQIGWWRLDTRRNILSWSDENHRIFGVPQGTPLTYQTFLAIVHPDDRAYVDRQWQAGLAGEPYDIEHRIVADGRVKWVREKAYLEFDEAGGLLGGFGITQDISGRKAAEEALRQAVQELRRSNEDLQQFAYVASHDLQEPLRMVSSFLGLLERRFGPELDDKARQYIGYAREGATRMSHLVRDLLAYSRVTDTGEEPQPCDTGEALAAALANLDQPVEQEACARITHDPLPVVLGDCTQITQLFQNLISNAIKFCAADRPCQVHIGARPQEGHWVLSVADNGIGIDPAHFERIFVIFQRLHTREQYPGTGIGLAICKKIVELHGGRIWVESKIDAGTTFFFTLPRAPAEEPTTGSACA
ncbi:MAG: ATP-binding protein [Thermodesulfobacteriota bacterium]